MATSLEELDVLKVVDGNFQSSLDHPTWTSFAKNARKDFEFREGLQWTSEEVAEIEKRGQAAIVENEIKPIIDRIIGQNKKQKTKIMFRGRNLGPDEQSAQVLTDLSLHAQQNSDYEFEEADMFDDGIVCGFGVMGVEIEIDDILDPSIKLNHVDVLNVFPDPNSRKYDWNKDADFISVAKWVTLEEAKKLYPSKAGDLQGYINLDPVHTEISNFKKDNYFDDKTKRVRIVEQEYKVRQEKKRVMMGNGDVVDVTNWNKGKINKFIFANEGSSVFEKVETKIKYVVFCGRVLLESKDSPYNHGLYKWVPYFIERKKDGEPYGKVRGLIDPQTEINKRRSKALHLLTTNQAVYEQGAIADKDELAREMAKPDGQIEVKAGREFNLEKNIEVASTQISLLGESKQALTRISGVGEDSLNRPTEVRSGVGLQRKQMQTDIIITSIFDNLRRTRLMIGRLIYELIKQYYNEAKTFEITDSAQKAKTISLTQENIDIIKEATYDIIVEEMPDTTTMQDEQFRMISDMLRSVNLPPNYSMALLPIMIQLSQIRNKDEVLQRVEQLSQPTPEHPKISLQLVWSELNPFEKAHFANIMGQEELAQMELQAGDEPAWKGKEMAGLQKEMIKQGGNGSA